MPAKQLSVFIENRKGRLGEVLHVLKENNVNIFSISLADTTEYGLLRLIVNDPEKGRDVLIDNTHVFFIMFLLLSSIVSNVWSHKYQAFIAIALPNF